MKEKKVLATHHFDYPRPQGKLPFIINRLDHLTDSPHLHEAHRHTFYELFYVIGGKGVHIIDFERIPAERGLLYFVSPGQAHFFEAGVDLEGYVILFSDDFVSLDPKNRHLLNELSYYNRSDATSTLQLQNDEQPYIEQLFNMLFFEYEERKFGRATVLTAYLQILLVEIERINSVRNPKKTPSRASLLVETFKKLVARLYIKEHSVKQYAQRLGISPGHLSDTIKNMTGITPKQIINKAIVLEAKRLLTHTDMTIEQIAYHLNFEDPSYFGRLFRREAAQSPGRFREEIRKKYHISV